MFFDARTLESGHTIEADICIVGAGAAGISIAREFIGSSTRVALIESGGFAYDEATQSLYTGDNIGLPTFDLEVNRLRYFGGTTNHWAGHCRPLDAIDFEERSWVENSGWPITRQELDPFYARAQPIVGLGPYEYENLEFWQDRLKKPEIQPDERRLKTVVYNQSPPTRFAPVYRDELDEAKNVAVYLNANVLEIETNENATQVSGLKLACIEGPELAVSARIYILATGGMENARLLLLSNRMNPDGLGNENGLVGRYFQDHLLLRPGVDISLSDPHMDLSLYHSTHKVHDAYMFAILASPEKLLRNERINNFRFHLIRARARYEKSMGGVFSKMDAPAEGRTQMIDTEIPARDSIALHMVLEPVPNPDSRISLSNKTDLFGQRKLEVNWQVTEKDLSNAYRALELAGLEFGRLGLGRAYGAIYANKDRWPNNLEAGRHHCGTTRMTDNPATGVVDKNCRVNGIDNLYIAGSSVFPTIGYANPTLTIVALALRLADHARELLAGRSGGMQK